MVVLVGYQYHSACGMEQAVVNLLKWSTPIDCSDSQNMSGKTGIYWSDGLMQSGMLEQC